VALDDRPGDSLGRLEGVEHKLGITGLHDLLCEFLKGVSALAACRFGRRRVMHRLEDVWL
jgi:hypothetical protein